MSRPRATDESGRPIVAELGRPETPEERADRRDAARRSRLTNQTALNLVIALIASLGIVAFLVLVVVRPDPPRAPVDYLQVARDAQNATDEPLVAPELPTGWRANRAQFDSAPADGVQRWEIGLITPDDEYIAIVQGIDANPSWRSAQLQDARSSGSVTLGGYDWMVYDRRNADDPGNLAYALVTTIGRSTVVLAGTASDAEFAELATAIGTAS